MYSPEEVVAKLRQLEVVIVRLPRIAKAASVDLLWEGGGLLVRWGELHDAAGTLHGGI
jgi:hypothetical protein